MTMPAWLLPLTLGGAMGGKGTTTVTTSTNQQVTQSSNTNVNPIIAVQTPAAHYDAGSNLEATSEMEQQNIPDQSWRQADPGGLYLPPGPYTEYDPASSERDVKATGGEANLSTLTGMPMILLIGGLAVVFMLFMRKRRR